MESKSTSSTASTTSLLSRKAFTPEQEKAIEELYARNVLLIAPKGFGKAAVGQTACQDLIDDSHLGRVLVLAPLKVCELTWANEWKKWSHLRKPALALGDRRARLAAINSDADIVVLNFENAKWFFEHDLHMRFDGLLVDESTKLKAAGGATFKALRPKLKHFQWRACMTADPVAEQGTDIYTQAMVVDGGKALGRNKELFMRRYFYPTDFQQRNWAVLPGQDAVLAERLKPLLWVVRDEGYEASLPELRDTIFNVMMPYDAVKAYDDMATSMYIDFVERDVEAVNAAVVSGKLCQITAGAVYAQDRDGKRVVQWLHNAKLLALRNLLKQLNGPVMIAYQFEFELEALREEYPEMLVLGDDPGKVEQLWNTGEIGLMAVHPKSAAHGLNLQYGGSHLVILSPIWSADQNEQLVGRLRRRGQAAKYVSRIHLVVPGTVDEVIIDRVLGKDIDSKALNRHLEEVARRRE